MNSYGRKRSHAAPKRPGPFFSTFSTANFTCRRNVATQKSAAAWMEQDEMFVPGARLQSLDFEGALPDTQD